MVIPVKTQKPSLPSRPRLWTFISVIQFRWGAILLRMPPPIVQTPKRLLARDSTSQAETRAVRVSLSTRTDRHLNGTPLLPKISD